MGKRSRTTEGAIGRRGLTPSRRHHAPPPCELAVAINETGKVLGKHDALGLKRINALCARDKQARVLQAQLQDVIERLGLSTGPPQCVR